MPSLIGSTVANNYLRVVGPSYTESGGARTYAGPFTNFGTRQLAFYKITSTGIHTGYTLSNSLFQKALNGVAITSELYFVGVPASDNVVFAIAVDTDAGTTSDNANDQTIQAAVRAASGDGSATVTALTASGASIA
jgi:hypothetical protein